jgi:hypothetical protein
MATRCNYGPTCQIPANYEASKSLKFKFIQIWLKMVPWFLTQIPFRILKNSNKEICSFFNYLHIHLLFGNFCAREGNLLIESIRMNLKIFKQIGKRGCSSRPAHRAASRLPCSALCGCQIVTCAAHARGCTPSSPSQTPAPIKPKSPPPLQLQFFPTWEW